MNNALYDQNEVRRLEAILSDNRKLPDTSRELSKSDPDELQEIFFRSKREVEDLLEEEIDGAEEKEHVKQIPEFFLKLGNELLEFGRSTNETPVLAGCSVGAAIIGAFTLKTFEKNDFVAKFDLLIGFIRDTSTEIEPADTEPEIDPSELERLLDDSPNQALRGVENFRWEKRQNLPQADCYNDIAIFYLMASKLMLWLGYIYRENSGKAISTAFCSGILAYNVKETYKSMDKYYKIMN